jgi:hypothetical protein
VASTAWCAGDSWIDAGLAVVGAELAGIVALLAGTSHRTPPIRRQRSFTTGTGFKVLSKTWKPDTGKWVISLKGA